VGKSPNLQVVRHEPDADARLVARLASGDVDAAAALYDRFAPVVLALARRILGDRSDAEDVAQEVFAQVWRTASRFDRERGSVAGWLVVMTRTRAIDLLRAKRARAEASAAGTKAPVESSDPLPSDVVLAAEQGEIVRRALGTLPAQQQAVLELAYFEGLTQSEIAARLSEPLGTVKTRMRTALIALREKLRT
jgi:RNA polymerase sigma-70 factor (ECF subfamily)